MSDDSGNDRSQKTVAELLALHGNSADSGRRRRRAAERDENSPDQQPGISDTAPQAIIDRVHGGGVSEAATDAPAEAEPEQSSGAEHSAAPQQHSEPESGTPQQSPPRMSQQSSRQQRQPSPQPNRQSSRPDYSTPQQQPAQSPQQPPRPEAQQPSQQLQQQPPQPPQPQQQNRPPKQQASQPLARPWGGRRGPLRPARRPESEPSTDQFPALGGGPGTAGSPDAHEGQGAVPQPQPGPQVPAGAPPAGLAKWRNRRREQQAEETDVGIVPPVTGREEQSSDSSVARALTGSAESAEASEPLPTGEFIPSFDTGTQTVAAPGSVDHSEPVDYRAADPAGYTAARSGERVDEYIDDDYFDPGEDYPDDDVVDDYVADYEDDYYDEYHDIDEDEYDDDVRIQGGAQRVHEDYADEDAAVTEADLEEPADDRSPGRQWLMLAGQLALGVLSGAGVWLGFSWLWNKFPSAALIAALIATVGLVWIVRKVRRADDTQTTVLAVLVGLIVTVSPAALLLVDR